MTRIAHLSDLHFGRLRAGLVEPLLDAIARAAPDLVVISGDFTQRARPEQFAAARGFLDRLEQPWLGVPGNHDIPLDRPFARFFAPFSGYRRALGPIHPAPVALDGMRIVGGVTASRWRWQAGWLDAGEVARLAALSGAADWRVAVLHHPIQQAEGADKDPVRGRHAAARALAAAGYDMVLSGHLHSWRAAPVAGAGDPRLLQLQVGSALSDRVPEGLNDFALIDFGPDAVEITRMVASPGPAPRFNADQCWTFHRTPDGWRAG